MKEALLLFLFSIFLLGCKPDEKEQPTEEEVKEEEYFKPTAFELLAPYGSTGFDYDFTDSLFNSPQPKAQVTQVHLHLHRKGKNKVWITPLDRVEAFLSKGKLYVKLFKRRGATEMGTVLIIEEKQFTTVASYTDSPGLPTPDMAPDDFLPAPHTLFRHPNIGHYTMQEQKLLLNKDSYEVGDSIYGALFYEGEWRTPTLNGELINPDDRHIYIKGGFKGIVREEGYAP